jgi:integrase/recombinase XerD
VRLRGKGKKERLLPLWRETADALHKLRGMAKNNGQQYVFLNRHGQPLTRDGVAYILRKYTSAVAAQERPALARKRITPHVLRHYLPRPTMSGSRISVHGSRELWDSV